MGLSMQDLYVAYSQAWTPEGRDPVTYADFKQKLIRMVDNMHEQVEYLEEQMNFLELQLQTIEAMNKRVSDVRLQSASHNSMDIA